MGPKGGSIVPTAVELKVGELGAIEFDLANKRLGVSTPIASTDQQAVNFHTGFEPLRQLIYAEIERYLAMGNLGMREIVGVRYRLNTRPSYQAVPVESFQPVPAVKEIEKPWILDGWEMISCIPMRDIRDQILMDLKVKAKEGLEYLQSEEFRETVKEVVKVTIIVTAVVIAAAVVVTIVAPEVTLAVIADLGLKLLPLVPVAAVIALGILMWDVSKKDSSETA